MILHHLLELSINPVPDKAIQGAARDHSHAIQYTTLPPWEQQRGFAAVLFGHTHVPNFYRRKGVLYFNPGSCGPRRFELPVTVGLLTIGEDGELEAEIIPLNLA
jgi:hypothetical protein